MKTKLNLLLLGMLVAGYSTTAEEVASIRLEESVITTTGFETTVRDVPTNISIVTSQEIEEKGYSSLQEVLESQAAINISNDTFGARVDLRGQGSDKARSNVKILVDGVSISPLNTSHGTLSLSSINVDNIESIEIIPGGGAILYGSGTAGGVINIITKSGQGMTPFNQVNFEAGSYDRARTSISAGTLVNENLLVQTNLNFEDGKAYVDSKENTNMSGEILTKYALSNSSDITLKYERSEIESHNLGAFLTEKEYDEDRKQIGSNGYVNQITEIKKDTASVIYNNNISDNLLFSIQGTYLKQDDYHDNDNGNRAAQYLTNQIQEEKVEISPKLKYKYGKNNSIVFGYNYTDIKSTRLINGVGKRNQDVTDIRTSENHSIFALNTYKINNIELMQGIRYSHTINSNENLNGLDSSKNTPRLEDTMDNMAYQLSANYLYSDTGNTYVKWERGFNTPDPKDMFNNPSESQSNMGYEVGPSNVSEETYDSFEIGVRDFIFGMYGSASVFYSKTQDEITSVVGSNSANWATFNLDETERKGFELSLEQYFGNLTLTQGYSFVNAEVTGGKYEGNRIPGVSENSFTFSAKYEFNNNFNTILSTIYRDAVYVENDNIYGKVNDYIVTDLIFNYSPKENIRIYAGINNLFNEIYASQLDVDNGILYKAANERNYFTGISYSF